MDKRIEQLKKMMSKEWTMNINAGYLFNEHFDGLFIAKDPMKVEMSISEESDKIEGEPLDVDALVAAPMTPSDIFEFCM